MDDYITLNEIAEHLQMCYRTTREKFIKGRRLPYLKAGRNYLIPRKAFETWVRENMTTVTRRW